MPYVSVGKENSKDIELYYKDWGSGQPIVFRHGWPLSADDWESATRPAAAKWCTTWRATAKAGWQKP